MPRQPRQEVTRLREILWERTQGRCEWPSCPFAAEEMAHRVGKGMGGRTSIYSLADVFALCTFHHRCQDGEGGEVISGRSRQSEVYTLYAELDPMTFSGDLLMTLDAYVTGIDNGGRRYRKGLKQAITEALATYAFAGRVPRTEDIH